MDPYPASDFARPQVSVRHAQGCVYLDSPQKLKEHPASITHFLSHWAERKGEQPFLTEIENGKRVAVSYSEALTRCQALASSLIEAGLGPEAPLAILSENSIAHGLLSLAAQLVKIPVVPISPAYSLLSTKYQAVRSIIQQVEPALIYAECTERYGPALKALENLCPNQWSKSQYQERLNPAPPTSPSLLAKSSEIKEEQLAKILFTSGSTGKPKGVLNSHGMLSSNQQAIAQIWPFLENEAPIIVDWLPWHHTFGGNHNFNMVLRHGGTLHIDKGKPAPGLMTASIEALKDVAPTLYFNVPQGFAMMLAELKADAELRARFFSRLRLMFYAGASLPQHLWEEYDELSQRERGQKVPFVSAWGSTETAPLSTAVHFPIPKAGIIGLPAPGTTIKLAPVGKKLEIRVKGPNVTRGYWKSGLSPFDEEGFYCSGDAGILADDEHPEYGIQFEGRLAEDFKLLSGTWVRVGKLRLDVLSQLSKLAQDLVIAGSGRQEIALLIVPKWPTCRELAGDIPEASVLEAPALLQALRTELTAYNQEHPSNSLRVGRAIFLKEPLTMDAGELTDKGSINQSAVLDNHRELVEALYSDTKMPGRVILE